jgi:glycosyltransferase involved in cell wall biosynthesis
MYKEFSGGIKRQYKLAKLLSKKYNVHLRIQKNNPQINYSCIDFGMPYSVGLPDESFPESDIVITYSDTPYGDELSRLPQVKNVLIYMLSYGMCINREKKNILNPKIIVLCSSIRTQRLIEKEGVKCYNISFGMELNEFYINSKDIRNNYASLLFHSSIDKKYELGVKVCNALYDEGLIDGVITFGKNEDFNKFKHPKKHIQHYSNANQNEVREVFNRSNIFIMPSISEGLNRTPIESTLCGCPSVLCDGAIDDVFFNMKTCFIAEKNNFIDIFEKSKELLLNPIYSIVFKNNIEILLIRFTWEKMFTNLENIFKDLT